MRIIAANCALLPGEVLSDEEDEEGQDVEVEEEVFSSLLSEEEEGQDEDEEDGQEDVEDEEEDVEEDSLTLLSLSSSSLEASLDTSLKNKLSTLQTNSKSILSPQGSLSSSVIHVAT